jgi:two-component system phosphate regulon sensor histidine kinase PhoR
MISIFLNMRKNIKILIAVSVLGLIGLSIIQGYLINNTYKLEKDVFINETKESISRIDDFSPVLDSINDIWQVYFLNTLTDYKLKQISREEVISSLVSKTDSINDSYVTSYNKELESKKIVYDLKFQKIIKKIILLDSIKNDTIFNSDKTKRVQFLGEHFKEEDGHYMSSSRWLTDHNFDREVDGKIISVNYNLQFETEDRMNIDGWEKIVLRRMTNLLAISIFIFLLVFGLLYYSIKNLITQKKIADIKTDFVNNITHELKTPLATLTLATKMLQKDNVISTSKIADSTVKTIDRQNIRLQKLIDQVLNNSLGYNEIQLKKETVNSVEYLNTILDDFMLSVSGQNVEMNRVIDGNKNILIDKFYFTTALFNLLENAIKYTEENVKINFSATVDNSFIISIRDNGIGISSKDQKLLFDKFFRAGNKEIHNVKGLGLGLYYTSQIIKAHSGSINVKSAENKGATFTIEIPLK